MNFETLVKMRDREDTIHIFMFLKIKIIQVPSNDVEFFSTAFIRAITITSTLYVYMIYFKSVIEYFQLQMNNKNKNIS